MTDDAPDSERESFNVCSCNKQGVCIVCRVWLDEKIDDMIDAWHEGDGADRTLHDYLGMTSEQYGRWLRDSTDIDVDVRRRLCWGTQ